jgi:hypothetical protein
MSMLARISLSVKKSRSFIADIISYNMSVALPYSSLPMAENHGGIKR